jgi:hypothetical protein
MQAQLAVYIYRHGHEKHDLFFDRLRPVTESMNPLPDGNAGQAHGRASFARRDGGNNGLSIICRLRVAVCREYVTPLLIVVGGCNPVKEGEFDEGGDVADTQFQHEPAAVGFDAFR